MRIATTSSYDEESETYYCEMELDEDEYMKFVSASFYNCPYYDPYEKAELNTHRIDL